MALIKVMMHALKQYLLITEQFLQSSYIITFVIFMVFSSTNTQTCVKTIEWESRGLMTSTLVFMDATSSTIKSYVGRVYTENKMYSLHSF